MMRSTLTSLVAGGLIAALPAGALGDMTPKQPFELVREMRTLQDETTQGNAEAHIQQRRLSAQIAQQLVSADPSVWSDPKNVRAAVIYTLSGGDPRVLKALFGVRSLPGVEERLLNGALAYGQGRTADAAELLAAIDARSLEPNLGAHVALVQSALLAAKDARKAIALLGDARLMAPGTLVEDAALRRQTFAVADTGDVDAFDALASHYMRRFAHSIYAGGFRDQFAVEVASERYGQSQERLAKLEAMLERLDVAVRRQCYLLIAHQAVIKGRVELARLVTRRAVALASADSIEAARAKVYEAAILIVTDDYDRGLEALRRIERSKLEERDAELADVAMAVASEVRRPAEPGETIPAADAGKNDGTTPAADTLKSVERAQQALARVDALLSGVP